MRTGSDVPRLRLSLMKLSLQVRLSDLDIYSGHVRRLMPEQLHHGREGHAGAKHFSGIVSEPVRISELDTGGLAMMAEQRPQTGQSHPPSSRSSLQRDKQRGARSLRAF